MEHGDHIVVRDAGGRLLEKRALAGPPGRNFPTVWACSEDEWSEATRENREPRGMAWPLEDVQETVPA